MIRWLLKLFVLAIGSVVLLGAFLVWLHMPGAKGD